MIPGMKLRKNKPSFNKSYQIYYLIISIIFVGAILYYTETLKRKTVRDTHFLPHLYARYRYFSQYEKYDSMLYKYYLASLIKKIDYPVIVTNLKYKPVFWKNLQISESLSYSQLKRNDKRYLRKQVYRLRKSGIVVPLTIIKDQDEKFIGYIIYTEPPAIDKLKYLPYLQSFLIAVFLSILIYSFSIMKRNEKDYIWIGLAKETAHQFGTPITSLFGWIEVMRMRFEHFDNNKDINSMLDHMETDITILQKVSSRFNKIGSQINLTPFSLDETIQNSIDYFNLRLPHFSNKIDICFINQAPGLKIKMDIEIMQWAIDNLLKNAIDSMNNKGGNIFITLTKEQKKISIVFMDEGCGIPKNLNYKSIFEPGVTSKGRGWGLGLSLTKRIIEEYHHGKVKVLHSKINEGTSFEISLPLDLIENPLN